MVPQLGVVWILQSVLIFVIVFQVPLCFSHHPPWKNGYNYQRTLPKDVMVDVINNFGLSLLEVHNEYNENNIAISPYGATSVLVAIAEGLLGEALHEIQHAVQLPGDLAVIRVGLRDIHRHLKSYFIPKEGFLAGLTLSHDNITLNREYESILRFYGYDIESFNNALYPEPFSTTQRTVSMTQRVQTTRHTTESTTKITTTTNIPTTIKLKPTDASTTTEIITTTDGTTTQTQTEENATTENLNTIKPERTTRGNGRPTKKRKNPTRIPLPADEDIISTTKRLPTRQTTLTKPNPTTTYAATTMSRGTTRFLDSTESGEMFTRSESKYPKNDLSSTVEDEQEISEASSTIATTTNKITTETFIKSEPITTVASTISETQTTTEESEAPNLRSKQTTTEESEAPNLTSKQTTTEENEALKTSTQTTTEESEAPNLRSKQTTIEESEAPNLTSKQTTTEENEALKTSTQTTTEESQAPKFTSTQIITEPTITSTTFEVPTTKQMDNMLQTFSGITIEEIITQPSKETTPINLTEDTIVEENSVTTKMPLITTTTDTLAVSEQIEEIPSGFGSNEITSTENVLFTTTNKVLQEIPENVNTNIIDTNEVSTEESNYDYSSSSDGNIFDYGTTSDAGTRDGENISDLDVTETSNEEVRTEFASTLNPDVDNVGTSTISPTTFAFTEVSADLSDLSVDTPKAEFSISANISDKDSMKPLKRTTRSVIDYIVARYYDNYHITSTNRRQHLLPPHPHPHYSNYQPDMPYTFLVNGKFREPNINFMTYDTVLPFHYISELNAMALSFPLDSNMYYLLLILPVDDLGIDKLIYDFKKVTTLKGVVENLKYTHVRAVIPSFMLKGYVVLTPSLQKLGIKKIFEPRHADFSQLTPEKNIYVTNIEQAVTVTIRNYVDPSSISGRNLQDYRPVEFKADHPFLYFVMDSQIHVNLMAGKITNPLNSRIR